MSARAALGAVLLGVALLGGLPAVAQAEPARQCYGRLCLDDHLMTPQERSARWSDNGRSGRENDRRLLDRVGIHTGPRDICRGSRECA